MKKLLLFFITIISIAFTFSFQSNAVLESVEFNVNIYDNYKYDLLTGDRSYDTGWASTNRLLINPKGENTIYLNSNTFHHVLFWDTSNKYMGYANSPLYADYDAPTNLGIPITDQFILPANTKYIAFLNNTGEFPVDDLNGYTLVEVFETTTLFDSEQLVTNGDFSDGTTGWTGLNIGTPTVTNGVVSFTPTAQYGYLRQLYITAFSNDKLYINTYYNPSSLTQRVQVMKNGTSASFQFIPTSTGFQVVSDVFNIGILSPNYPEARFIEYGTSFSPISIDYFYLFNISTLISNNQYSTIYDTTFDLMSDAEIKAQMDAFINKPYQFIDYDSFGFYLSSVEMDAYYLDYIDFISNWFNILSASALETLEPTYQRDFTPIVDEPIGTDIDNYLDSINANTPFAKALLSVALIVIAVIMLAIVFKTPKIVYLMVAVALYLLFTILGWLPAWLLIIIALIVLLIMFISFKSNGGNSND